MDVREKMRKWREEFGITLEMISKRCGVSVHLLGMVEDGEVTHPDLVKKIQDAYGLTDLESEELMPENHRPHSPNYDPDKYVIHVSTATERLLPKQSVIDRYLTERHRGTYVRYYKDNKYYKNEGY